MTGHRNRRAGLLAAIAAVMTVVGLSGCAATTAAPAAPPTSTGAASAPTPSSSAAQPLACGDLVDQQEVVRAFTPRGTTASGSITPTTPWDTRLLGPVAVAGAGGLACAWRVGTGASAGTLLVEVLPGAASQWSALMYGDGPTSERHRFAGIEAAATCGDPGCGASAVVGSSWVRADLVIPGLNGASSAMGRESTTTILDGAAPVFDRLFTTVQRASAARLAFPAHPGSPSGTPRCEGILPAAQLAPLLSSSSATYDLRRPTGASDSIDGAAAHDLGSFECFANGSSTAGDSTADLVVAPGQAWAVKTMEGSRYSDTTPLRPVRLAGATSSETAETTCASGATTPCTVVFSLGTLAIQVDDSPHAVGIAEAVIANAR